jgi:hypothetical protein
MTAPLVPYAKSYASSPAFEHLSRGYKQKPPYNIDTEANIERMFGKNIDGRSWNWGPGDMGIPAFVKGEQQVINKALQRFEDKLGDKSSFGATLTAERKETFSMLTSTVIKLARAANAIRKLNFGTAAQILGLPYKERTITKTVFVTRKGKRRPLKTRKRVFDYGTGRDKLKTLANGWLLWSYGAKPLMQDIYNGMDVLQRPLLYAQKNKASARFSEKHVVYSNYPQYKYFIVDTWELEVVVSVQANVSVKNPDLALADQLGLTNPLQWVNEAIPLSFIVDWFSNLSQMIGYLSRFAGLDISQPCTGKLYRMVERSEWTLNGVYDFSEKERRIYNRSIGIPPPTFVIEYERFSVQRGLNAISLLIGMLRK